MLGKTPFKDPENADFLERGPDKGKMSEGEATKLRLGRGHSTFYPDGGDVVGIREKRSSLTRTPEMAALRRCPRSSHPALPTLGNLPGAWRRCCGGCCPALMPIALLCKK